ncbi:MAG: bifunctional metallophosphatase/5'-nucleotidase [Chromatiaceae bacterium]|nr:bifunctional metallophosphatase/5'-nucleotidase [Chromatiaceae bacterium]
MGSDSVESTGARPGSWLRGRFGVGVRLLVLLLAWVALGGLVRAGEVHSLTILHFNDLHGQLEPAEDPMFGRLGGIARLAGAVQAVRAEVAPQPVLVLFGGDLLQGTVTSTVFLGLPDIGFLGDLGVDAAVMGNHELDYGQEVFRDLLAAARFPVLAANLRAEPEPFAVTPAVVLHPPGGPRVAVLGLVTDELTTTTHPRNIAGISVEDPVASARRWVPALAAQADLVVVLSHLGITTDTDVDLVVGGHNHHRYATPVVENGVPIVQAGERGTHLGRLDLRLHDGGVGLLDYRLIPVDARFPEDPRLAAEVRALADRLEDEVGVVIGHSAVELDARRLTIRRGESNFGNWVCDLARDRTGTDIALFNGGGFRASIAAGAVRIKDVYQAFPFGNELVTGSLTGAQIQQALDRSASLDPQDDSGGFLQVSGLRYTIAAGRAVEVTVRGQPLEHGVRYRVVMPDFLAAGGDGYLSLNAMEDRIDTGTLISDLVMDAFRTGGVVAAANDGRIRRLAAGSPAVP